MNPENPVQEMAPDDQIDVINGEENNGETPSRPPTPGPSTSRHVSSISASRPFYRPKLRKIDRNKAAIGRDTSDPPPKLEVLEQNFETVVWLLEMESLKVVQPESNDDQTKDDQTNDDQTSVHETPAAKYYDRFAKIVENSLDNVTMFRSYHPVLRRYRTVYLDAANRFWVVDIKSMKSSFREAKVVTIPLKIGGCKVHLHSFELVVSRTLPDPFPAINPKELLADEQLAATGEYFPLSIGLRVLVWGTVQVIFESEKKMRKQLKGQLPKGIFGLPYSFVVNNTHPTSDRPKPGMQVANEPDEAAKVYGSVGLRIRREQDNFDSWTTATHGLIPLTHRKDKFNTRHAVKNLASSVGESLRGIGNRQARKHPNREQSLIGTRVFTANDSKSTQIGTITTCYDDLVHPGGLPPPFPYGYKHDLSLITKDPSAGNMPTLINPENLPRILPYFATPAEILASPSAFIAKYPVRWEDNRQEIAAGAAKEALISGVEYYWQRKDQFSVSRSIIWRTEEDSESAVAGGCGSALFLGEITAKTCRAACFQNFEHRVNGKHSWMQDLVRNEEIRGPEAASYKGGFFLPAEVLEAAIVVERAKAETKDVSGETPPEPSGSKQRTSEVTDVKPNQTHSSEPDMRIELFCSTREGERGKEGSRGLLFIL